MQIQVALETTIVEDFIDAFSLASLGALFQGFLEDNQV
jgi:hypothetical protein